MDKQNMTEEEMLKEIERLQRIELEQAKILRKRGSGYQDAVIDDQGRVVLDANDKNTRQSWDME